MVAKSCRAMTSNSKRLTIIAVVAVFVMTAVAAVLPRLIRAHSTTASNTCVNNLRQIDSAKQQWMLECNQSTNQTPSWDAICPYLRRAEIPRCPQGGRYILGRVGEPPRCSIGGSGHSL
ncbi:conserved exported hypothetical protein [Verrucomicrobia bacterium]|nr:conserved exported hypothetical protein [Verrucomicrobiota bacterium]